MSGSVFTIGHSTHDPDTFVQLLGRHEVEMLVDVRRYPGSRMGSEEFAATFERLCRLARERRVAVMCAEAPWWRCHRRLLADALLVHDFEVRHIDSRGNAEPHRLTEQALVEGARITYPP